MKCSSTFGPRSERALQKSRASPPPYLYGRGTCARREWSRPLRVLRSSSAFFAAVDARGAVAVSTPPEGEGCRRTSAPSSRRQRSWSSQPKVSTPRTSPYSLLQGLPPKGFAIR
ncbi:hypothetical protein CEXT_654561 [Caerostris extrusa]|uniref:Uncharacterized protein n=1 Tax=Caerostris extrusa TaxID=172846 RepID=A0AAV4PH17_CAEEX|nr:hypothetical protein CEXT_654561 [Caerostris extrusa]